MGWNYKPTQKQLDFISDNRPRVTFNLKEEKKMGKKFELPFKGTASAWWSSVDRITPVSKLDDAHLVNILKFLHDIADEKLIEENPYNLFSNEIFLNLGEYVHKPYQRNIWLIENCITWPALKREAMKRGMFNPDFTAKPKVVPAPPYGEYTQTISKLKESIAQLTKDNQTLATENWQLKDNYKALRDQNERLVQDNTNMSARLHRIAQEAK